jgi:hypothetical protein
MTVERSLRLLGGGFVVASVALGIWVNIHFLWFTLFVGLNLFQSAFTQWCPMVPLLRRTGMRHCVSPDESRPLGGEPAGA